MPPPSIPTPLRRRLLRSHHSRLFRPPPPPRPRNACFTRAHSTHPTPSSASTSADPNEIIHFTSLAATWWDPHGPSRILHLMNPLRIQFLQQCLSSGGGAGARGGLRYLDVGCGGGILSEALARLPDTRSVVGIDPTRAVLEVARQHLRTDAALARGGRLAYRNATIEALAEGGEGFDVITVMEVLEHVSAQRELLHHCLQRVRPGGWVVGSTIARHPLAYVTTKIFAEGLLRLVPWGTHDWRRYVDVEEIRQWVREMDGRRVAGSGGGDGAVWRSGGDVRVMGCVYVPGLGWRGVSGAERVGNYLFGVRRAPVAQGEGG
ncbi:S-adenosyl-L-methionine-dependent methyltransferase, partial [Tirmania nivea]